MAASSVVTTTINLYMNGRKLLSGGSSSSSNNIKLCIKPQNLKSSNTYALCKIFSIKLVNNSNNHPARTMTVRGSSWSKYYSDSSENDEAEDEEYAREITKLKEEVRNKLSSTNDYDPKDKMVLIDTLERIGVAHHFEEEIEDQLKQIIKFYTEAKDEEDSDLFTTALYFRLLRQQGYDVPCSVFDKFKGEDGMFKQILCDDIEGLLSLYEASYLRYLEEGILQEARDYARRYLNKAKLHLEDSYLKEKVTRALKQPLHWAVPKAEARYYISFYERKESNDEAILRLAKLDFRLSQNLYRKELNDVIRWLSSFDNLLSKLPYARNTALQGFLWAAAFCYEPQHSLSRVTAAKMVVVAILLNDTYDSYATMEELEVFTPILLSWDTKEIDKLPKFLRILYEAILSTFTEFENQVAVQERSYRVDYLKETVKEMAWAFHMKTKWYKRQDQSATFQEHKALATHTSGARQMMAACCVHFESASKESFDWLMSMPRIVEEAGFYCRLLNDMATYEREHETGQFPTAVDRYMKEEGLTKQETLEKFAELAEGSWMIMNKEWTTESKCCVRRRDVLKRAINNVRVVYASYGQRLDGFTTLQGRLATLADALLDPIII